MSLRELHEHQNTRSHTLWLCLSLSLQSLNQLYTPIFSITHPRKSVEVTAIFIDSLKCKQNFKPTLLIQSFRFLLHAVILFGASIVFDSVFDLNSYSTELYILENIDLYWCNIIYGVCTIWLTGNLFIEYFTSIANTCWNHHISFLSIGSKTGKIIHCMISIYFVKIRWLHRINSWCRI